MLPPATRLMLLCTPNGVVAPVVDPTPPPSADAPAPDSAAGSTAADPALTALVGDPSDDPSSAPQMIADVPAADAVVVADGGAVAANIAAGTEIPFTVLSVSMLAIIGGVLQLLGATLHLSTRRVARSCA